MYNYLSAAFELLDLSATHSPEPIYCLCQQEEYGEMLACDAEDISVYVVHVVNVQNIFLLVWTTDWLSLVTVTAVLNVYVMINNSFCSALVSAWFHFACINITQRPSGKWLCPECQPLQMKRPIFV